MEGTPIRKQITKDVTWLMATDHDLAEGFLQHNQLTREFGTHTTQETVSVGGISVTSDIQAVTLLASVPLTDEDWQPLPKNTILALSQGEIVARA